jgi:hypothetical protein
MRQFHGNAARTAVWQRFRQYGVAQIDGET